MQDAIQIPVTAFLLALAGAISLRPMALRRWAILAAAALALWIASFRLGAAPTLLGACTIAVLCALAIGLGRLLQVRRAIAWLDHRLLGTPALLARPISPKSLVLPIALLLAALLATHLALVFLAAIAASWSAFLMARASGGLRWPLVPALATLLLLVTYRFVATVAGPEGLSLAGLAALPLSPAAERLLGAALLAASWLLSGLWPLHRWTPSALFAPIGALLLVRVGLVAAPDGVEHWRALAVPLAMLGIWHAAAIGWAPGLAVGGAWLALASGGPAGITAAVWLFPSAFALELLERGGAAEPPARRWVRGLVLFAAGWGGLLALEAGLHGEVVYTVLAAAGGALGLAGGGQAMTPSAPRSTAPRL